MSSKSIDSGVEDRLSFLNREYRLRRYPLKHRRELRAWDNADLYLIQTTLTELTAMDAAEDSPLERPVCVLNDTFGALTTLLLDRAQQRLLLYGDSWMSRRALELNLELNDLPTKYTFEESLERLITENPSPSLVIGRVPKSSHQLSYLLDRLNEWLEHDTLLLLAGMDKHLSRGQYDLLAKRFGPSSFMPGIKKSRIWRARSDKSLHSSPSPLHARAIELPEHNLKCTALPNVFSHDKLDVGSRFFIEHLERLPKRVHVADMACGYGVLGLAYLNAHPEAQLTFCDESFQAVASTQINLERNFPSRRAKIYANDGLKGMEESTLELVLCNPPFHQNHTVSTDVASSLFRDAHRALISGGELWIVANRHLGYHRELKRLFNRCETIASHQKFVILCAVK